MDSEEWQKFCELTTAEYPLPLPKKTRGDDELDLNTWRVLRPVLWSLVKALPALVATLCKMAFHYACKVPVSDGCAFVHADTPRNALLVKKLKACVAAMPPPTYWAHDGDLATLVPFVLFGGGAPTIAYTRRWLRVHGSPAPDGPRGFARRGGDAADDEAVAVDAAFPAEPNVDGPVFLVLHGLNGGSAEPYVLDFVERATGRGFPCFVMIGRGLMRTPVREHLFTGARTSDVGAAVEALARAYGDRVCLVGNSMGGVICENYVAKAGKESKLASCVALSGTICSQKILEACGDRSRGLWQPMLTYYLKDSFTKPCLDLLDARRVPLGPILDASSIDDFDRAQVCPFHGYPALTGADGYYADMAAAGAGDDAGLGKLARVAVPTLLVHGKDDPITPYEAQLPRELHASKHIVLLETDVGGHTGWPRGPDPREHRWRFMVDVAVEFAVAAHATRPFQLDVGDGPIFTREGMPRQTARSRAAKAGKL